MIKNINIQNLNDYANDLAVLRAEIVAIEAEREKIIEAHEELRELQISADSKRAEKEKLQTALLDIMRQAGTKAWKTEQCTVSRAIRETVTIDKTMEPYLKNKLRAGEQIEGLLLKTTEFISIRSVPKK